MSSGLPGLLPSLLPSQDIWGRCLMRDPWLCWRSQHCEAGGGRQWLQRTPAQRRQEHLQPPCFCPALPSPDTTSLDRRLPVLRKGNSSTPFLPAFLPVTYSGSWAGWKATASAGFHKPSLLQLLSDYSSSDYFFITESIPRRAASSLDSQAHFLPCRAAGQPGRSPTSLGPPWEKPFKALK